MNVSCEKLNLIGLDPERPNFSVLKPNLRAHGSTWLLLRFHAHGLSASRVHVDHPTKPHTQK